jgi:phage/conjugal plasmid C-4 type zinc finger TraR family protein
MDVVDKAQEAEEALREGVLSLLQRHAPLTQSGTDCLRCGREIDERRRIALPGCCLCFMCQEATERLCR